MGSSRLPGKMTADIAGKPALIRVIERLNQAKSLDGIVLATSINSADDVLADIAAGQGISVFRGSEEDVLKRVCEAHAMMESDIVVEICGDCPLIDPEIIDQAVETYKANKTDMVAVGAKQSFPQGTEVQVFSADTLAEANSKTNDPAHREHVTLYFHENEEKFDILHLMAPKSLQAPELRLQLDYPQDLELISQIYCRLEPSLHQTFRTADILSLIKQFPDLADINSDCEERAVR